MANPYIDSIKQNQNKTQDSSVSSNRYIKSLTTSQQETTQPKRKATPQQTEQLFSRYGITKPVKRTPSEQFKMPELKLQTVPEKKGMERFEGQEISQAEPKTKWQKIGQKITDFLEAPETRVARDQNTYAIQKVIEQKEDAKIPLPIIKDNFDYFTKELGIRDVPTGEELVNGVMTVALATGLIMNPVPTLVGLVGFGVLQLGKAGIVSTIKPGAKTFTDLLPENTPNVVVRTLSAIELLADMAVFHKIYSKTPEIADILTKDITTKYELPKTLEIDKATIRQFFIDDSKLPKSTRQAIIDLKLSSAEIKTAVKNGVAIEVPWTKVVTVADKPYWSSVKKIFRIPGTPETVFRTTLGETVESPYGLLEPGEYTGQEILNKVIGSESQKTSAGKKLIVEATQAKQTGQPIVIESKEPPKPITEPSKTKKTTKDEEIVKIEDETKKIDKYLKDSYGRNLTTATRGQITEAFNRGAVEYLSYNEALNKKLSSATKGVTSLEGKPVLKFGGGDVFTDAFILSLDSAMSSDIKQKIIDKEIKAEARAYQKAGLTHEKAQESATKSVDKRIKDAKAQNYPPYKKILPTKKGVLLSPIGFIGGTGNETSTIFTAGKNHIALNTDKVALFKKYFPDMKLYGEADPSKPHAPVGVYSGSKRVGLIMSIRLSDDLPKGLISPVKKVVKPKQQPKPKASKVALKPKSKGVKPKGVKVKPKKKTPKVKAKKTRAKLVPRGQVPVGEGKVKVSALEARIKHALGSLSEEQIKEMGLATYRESNQDKNIAKAAKFVTENTEDAMRVLEGKIDAPKGILRNSILIALQNLSPKDMSLDMANRLATLFSTRAGQEIAILRKVNKNLPVNILSDIIQIRTQAVEKRFGGKTIDKITKAKVKKGESMIKAPTNWDVFLREVRC